jgi:hypothetical protein
MMMSIGRNDPWPCGSGKKYKRCCMSYHAADTSPGNPLTEAKAEINKFIEGKQFSSQDDLQAQVQSFYQQRNQTPLDDFQGLSPEQMHRMLYFPFDTPRLVSFPQVLPTKTTAPAITLFSLLTEAIGQKGLKSTATGNLPQNFCREAAQTLWGQEKYRDRTKYAGINTETDFFELHIIRITATIAGLIRKYRSRFVLTKKCSVMLAGHGMDGIYPLLFAGYVRRFNWAYRDRYPELGFIQQSFLFSLYLLFRHGADWHPNTFYEDCFLKAFPMVIESVGSHPMSSPEETVRSCYTWRCLVNFAGFFGLAQVEPVSEDILNREYRIKKQPLLDQAVHFHFST